MASRGFWRELKRRHVYRVAAAYALVGWLLIQVATQVFPVFHLPDWIDQTVVLLILLGFPIALVLAWAFDATPQGVVRTDASSLEEGADAQPRGRSQRAGIAVGLIGVLIAVAAGAGWWYMQHGRDVVAQESRAIADKLQVQLSGGNEATLVAQKSVDPRAHDFYLRGLTLLAARSVGEAVGAFRQAVVIDPDYAQAWAALAEAQALLPAYGPTAMQTANADSLDSAQRALTANPDVALAYVAQGMVYMDQMRWADADGAFRHALALAPGDAEALNQYGQFLEGVGQLEPALAQFDRAWQRDPLSGVNGAIRVQLTLMLHHDDAATAAAQIRAILDAHPESLYVHRSAALIYLNLHRYPDAEAQSRAAAVLNGTDPEATVQVIRGIADPALRAQAVHSLDTSPGNSGVKRDAILHAFFLVQLGERDRALAALEDYATHGNGAIQQLLWFPAFDPIRNDPRFKAALKKMGLPYIPKNLSTM